MNRHSSWLLGAAFACASLFVAGTATAQVTVEVMNPRGEIPPPPTRGISPRVGSLEGKKIVLVDNGKFGADNFLYVVAQLIKQKYPNTTVVIDPKPSAQTITDLPKWYPTVKQQGDLFVFGVGD
jgi:predicted GTPase